MYDLPIAIYRLPKDQRILYIQITHFNERTKERYKLIFSSSRQNFDIQRDRIVNVKWMHYKSIMSNHESFLLKTVLCEYKLSIGQRFLYIDFYEI